MGNSTCWGLFIAVDGILSMEISTPLHQVRVLIGVKGDHRGDKGGVVSNEGAVWERFC